MLNKCCKLLLGVYILKRLSPKNSQEISEVSEPKRCGAVRKYGKLILGAYLMKRFKTGRYYGTRESEESSGRLLHKYGSLMLTTYAMKKLRSRKSHKGTEPPEQYTEPSVEQGSFLPHMAKRYGKWLLGVYLLRRFHYKEPEAEIEEMAETEPYDEEEETSMLTFNKIILGALAGISAMYVIKKYRAKCCEHNIDVE